MKVFERLQQSTPREWESVRLGNLCEVFRGSSPRPKGDPRFFGGPIPWISIADVTAEPSPYLHHTKEGVTPEGAKRSRLVEAGQLILSNSATICVPKLLAIDGCIHDGFLSFRDFKYPTDLKYLYHFFGFVGPHVRREFKQGVTQSNLNTGIAKAFAIPLPPLPEQKRIAAILDAADALRAKRRESIEQLDSLVQATFLEMFGDPVTNPKGWVVEPLGRIASNEDGKRVPVKKADREKTQGHYPYYGASGVIDHVDDYLFDGERLLIGEDGANLLARSTPIAFRAHGKYWVNNHAHVLADNGEASLVFLETLINRLDLTQYVSGSAQPKLTQKSLNAIPIPTPPLNLQTRFASIVESIEVQKAQLQAHLAELDALFSSLQSRAFNGELVA